MRYGQQSRAHTPYWQFSHSSLRMHCSEMRQRPTKAAPYSSCDRLHCRPHWISGSQSRDRPTPASHKIVLIARGTHHKDLIAGVLTEVTMNALPSQTRSGMGSLADVGHLLPRTGIWQRTARHGALACWKASLSLPVRFILCSYISATSAFHCSN